MKTVNKIETRLDKFQPSKVFGYFSENEDKWIELETDSDCDLAAKKLGISKEALLAISNSMEFAFSEFTNLLICDLNDIWERLDKLGEQVNV